MLISTSSISTFPRPTTDAQCEQLWNELLQTAATASAEYLDIMNADNADPRKAHVYGGGLGSGSIKIPNRGKFAKWLLATGNGWVIGSSRGVHLKTWARYGFPQTYQSEGHSLYFHKALRDRLADYGLEGDVSSYSS